MKPRQVAIRISMAYAIFAALWILLSDQALVLFVSDPQAISRLSMYKGWAFVLVTGILLYGTLRTQLQRWQREVSARIEAEQSLHESEERYRVAIESSKDGVTLVKDNKHIFVNQRFLHMFGYAAAEEVLGKSLFMTVHPDDRDMVAGHALKGEEGDLLPSSFEFRGLTKDGTVKWIEATAARITYLGEPAGLAYLSDVTERKRAEEGLRASRLQLAVAAQMAKVAYWEHDEATGEFTFNDPFYDLFATTARREGGYLMSRAEYYRRFVHPDDLEELQKQVNDNKARPRTDDPEQYEHRAIRRDGEVIHILNRNRAIMDFEGHVVKVVGVNQDITTRKKMEERIRSSLAEKEVLLREIHHRVKNNLAVIAGILSLQADSDADGCTREILLECRNRIKAMAEIHTQLYQSENFARIDFSEYLGRLTADIFHNYRAERNDVALQVTAGNVSLDIDHAIPLGLIINELITNSLKHAFRNSEKGEIAIDLFHSGQRTILRVSDNGVGFPAGLDYRKTESLGMQLVVTLVEQLGGTIQLNCERGTEFLIAFKAGSESPAEVNA